MFTTPIKIFSWNLALGLLTITSAFSGDNPLFAELKSSKLFVEKQEMHAEGSSSKNQKIRKPAAPSCIVVHHAPTLYPVRYKGLNANHHINVLLINRGGGMTLPFETPLVLYTKDGRTINTGIHQLTVGSLILSKGVSKEKDISTQSSTEKIFKNREELEAWLDGLIN